MSGRVVVLDLDGTLCLGDAPVLRYAAEAFSALSPSSAARAHELLARFLSGDRLALPGVRDGYQAVAQLGEAAGLDRRRMSAAFHAARQDWGAWADAVHAPQRLLEALAGLDGVRRVLVTNSPATGLDDLLPRLGIDRAIDEVVTDAAKPRGLPGVLDGLGLPASVGRARLLSVGDRWDNDLAPVAARGGTTVLVRAADGDEPAADVVVPHPDAAADAVRRWGSGAGGVTSV